MGPTATKMQAAAPPVQTRESQGGAVPQAGVNPQAQQAPQQGQPLSPDDLDFFRNDPELIQAVAKFFGRPIDMNKIPDQAMAAIAGMVQKLGVDGAIAEFKKSLPPGALEKMRIGSNDSPTTLPRRDANGIPL